MTEVSAEAARPPVVSEEEWQRQREELLRAEKEATRALDALAARRRRLPMVRFDHNYVFDTPEGRRPCSTCSKAGRSSSCTSSWTTDRTPSVRAAPTSRATWPTWAPSTAQESRS